MERNGISLIVLVITIIVIIILAVAVILTLANNNPIENAKDAVTANDEAVYKEEATLEYADWYTKKNLGTLEEVYKDKSAEEYVKAQMRKKGYTEEVLAKITITDEGEIRISKGPQSGVKDSIKIAAQKAYDKWLDEMKNGNTSKTAEEYVKQELNNNKYSIDEINKVYISDDGSVNAVTIPNGFEYKEGTVKDGYVIKNTTDNNEFVWVPVETGTFERKEFPSGTVDTTYYIEPYTKDDYISEKTEYDAMVESVNTYGGFYIARYEASNNGSDKAQSLPNKTPWSSIPWGDGMTKIGTTGVVAKARAVYPDSSTKTTGDAVSTLTYGIQWDATLSFILNNYTFVDVSENTQYGNYLNTETYEENLVNTGSVSTYALNNIYDFVGNVQEWTMEAYYYVFPDSTVEESRIVRGGYYSAPISSISNYGRMNQSPNTNNNYTGFRLALYIK